METYASTQLLSGYNSVIGIGILRSILYITIVYALVLFILPRYASIPEHYTTGIISLLVLSSINATYSLIQNTQKR